jgi:nicotinate-nucleotide adenylyltransferase
MWFAGPARLVPEAGRPSAQKLGFHLEPGMRVGLFGGSFNPAHEGHAHVAETAMRRLELDRVIWLVSPQNPLKSSHETRPLAERMAGVRRWAQGRGMIVSDAETRLGSQYTIDTLRVLRARFPGVKFVWVMGADSLAGFHRWRAWREIAGGVPLAVVDRPGWTLRAARSPAAAALRRSRVPECAARLLPLRTPPAWCLLHGPRSTLSSTALRDKSRSGTAQR